MTKQNGPNKKKPPLSTTERRRKSDAAKAEAGEKRVTTWLPKEGAQALTALVGAGKSGAYINLGTTDREVINTALVHLAVEYGVIDKKEP